MRGYEKSSKSFSKISKMKISVSPPPHSSFNLPPLISLAIPRPLDPMPVYQPASSPSPSSPTPSSGSSSTSSPALKNQKPVKKRQKKVSLAGPGGVPGKGEAEGLHVCVTCGRTDSPEWRKGPLGPKTLCNVRGTLTPFDRLLTVQACGLRWAKRNSTAPSRKEKKLLAESKKA